MLDGPIFKNVIDALRAGLTAQGSPTDPKDPNYIQILQNFQPTSQGMPSGPTLYIHKLGDRRYGFLGRTDEWDPDVKTEKHTETQVMESMFQISALSIQNPKLGAAQLTASDIANMAAGILQSDVTREFLTAKGLNIYRITDVRNPYFVDDKARYEAAPSFDFTLQHEQVIISETPTIEAVEFVDYPI